MEDTISRRSKLDAERLSRLQTTTKEQRIEQARKLVEGLDEFGKRNFPLAPKRWGSDGE